MKKACNYCIGKKYNYYISEPYSGGFSVFVEPAANKVWVKVLKFIQKNPGTTYKAIRRAIWGYEPGSKCQNSLFAAMRNHGLVLRKMVKNTLHLKLSAKAKRLIANV